MSAVIESIEDTPAHYDFTLGDVTLLHRRAGELGVPALKLVMGHTGCTEDEAGAWLVEIKRRGLTLPRRKLDRFYGDRDHLFRPSL